MPTPNDRLRSWLDGVLPSRVDELRPLAGGHRSAARLVRYADGTRYVLRVTERCAVEAALARRLAGVVAVPEVVATDPDGAATGTPMLLSRYVDGHPLDELLSTVDDSGARELGAAVARTLTAIGTITFPSPGFLPGADLRPSPAQLPADLPAFVDRCLADEHAMRRLTPRERDGIRELAARAAPLLARLPADARLVHSDFNPKNLLATRDGGHWTIAAVLDWEFAFSGSPLADAGNMLRFADDYPAGYVAAFRDGYRAGAGGLPPDWPELAAALDLFALADLLTRAHDNPVTDRVIRLLRARMDNADSTDAAGPTNGSAHPG